MVCSQEKLTKIIVFVFDIANARGLLVGIIRNLVVIAARRSDQSQLIVGSLIKDQRTEAAEPCRLIMQTSVLEVSSPRSVRYPERLP